MSFVAGCASGLADSYALMTVHERALGIAAKDLPQVSEQQQKKCVDDNDSKQAADDCRTRVKNKVAASAKVIEGSQAAHITAKDMIQGTAAAAKTPKEVLGWIGVAIRTYVDVDAALSQLGYHLGE
jgi:hypothetical protein